MQGRRACKDDFVCVCVCVKEKMANKREGGILRTELKADSDYFLCSVI